MTASGRPNGRKIRDSHRHALTLHFCAMLVGLAVVAFVNRAMTPGTLWVHWVGLAWAVAFGLHLRHFFRGTMATMGSPRPAEPAAAADKRAA